MAEEIAEECAKCHINPYLAQKEQLVGGTHVFLLFEDGEIVFTKCGEKGYMFMQRGLHTFHPPVPNRSGHKHIDMPWKCGEYKCVVMNDEKKAMELREKIRMLNAITSS